MAKIEGLDKLGEALKLANDALKLIPKEAKESMQNKAEVIVNTMLSGDNSELEKLVKDANNS